MLKIEPFQLVAGFVYVYNVTANVTDVKANVTDVKGTAQVFIDVRSADLVAKIDWVGEGNFNSDLNLRLDASDSYDPDS